MFFLSVCRLNTTLDKHKKVHTDEKPYNCFICEERFSRKIYRDTHMYKHTGKLLHRSPLKFLNTNFNAKQ